MDITYRELKDYYLRHMADGSFVSWLALDGERIIGTSGMSFVEKPPYFECRNELNYIKLYCIIFL
jgi:hypothetical protein